MIDFKEIESHQSLLIETLNKLLELMIILDDVEVWDDIVDVADELRIVVESHKKLLSQLDVKNSKSIFELKSNMLVFEILLKNIENIKIYAKMKNRLKLSDNIEDIEELIIQYIRKENELLFPTIKEFEGEK